MALVGERKAIVSAVLVLYALMFLVIALTAPDESLVPYMGAMSAMYGLGFFSVVAGYFWARWFAIGLGLYGLGVGALLLWQIGPDPIALFYTGTHGVVSLLLGGNRMAAHFDGRSDWRDRYHLDDNGTQRLGRAVIRAGVTLPVLLAYGLAPRESAMDALLVGSVVGLGLAGLWGLLRMRTWGIVALISGAIAVLASTAATAGISTASAAGAGMDLTGTGMAAAVLLLATSAPFIGPMVRYLRS